MSAKPILITLGIGLMIGVGIGSTSSDPPKTITHTIRLPPKIITHVEHDTVYETVPLPDSCVYLTEQVAMMVESAGNVNRVGSKIRLRLQSVSSDQLRDPTSVYKYQTFLNTMIGRSEGYLTEAMEVDSRLQTLLETCQGDIADD